MVKFGDGWFWVMDSEIEHLAKRGEFGDGVWQ